MKDSDWLKWKRDADASLTSLQKDILGRVIKVMEGYEFMKTKGMWFSALIFIGTLLYVLYQ